MRKARFKFQKNPHKIVGGVAHTRYPISIHFQCNNAWKMIRSTCEKMTKIT